MKALDLVGHLALGVVAGMMGLVISLFATLLVERLLGIKGWL